MDYLEIPTLFITLTDNIEFNIYIRRNNNFVLYATPDNFTEDQKIKLKELGIESLFINNIDKLNYTQYIEDNLPNILNNPIIPIKEKGKIIYDHSLELVNNIFRHSETECLNSTQYDQIKEMVNNIFNFLSTTSNGIQTIQKLISTNYKDYVHSINATIYTIALLIQYSVDEDIDMPKKSFIKHVGVGTLLHDIGMLKVPNEIICKKVNLNNHELDIMRKHPIYGLEITQLLDLEQIHNHIILFHHEKVDGSRYPTGTKNVPFVS